MTFGWTKFRWFPLPPRLTNPDRSKSEISSRTFGGKSRLPANSKPEMAGAGRMCDGCSGGKPARGVAKWLPGLGSNQGLQLQRLTCYRYTTGQRGRLARMAAYAMESLAYRHCRTLGYYSDSPYCRRQGAGAAWQCYNGLASIILITAAPTLRPKRFADEKLAYYPVAPGSGTWRHRA